MTELYDLMSFDGGEVIGTFGSRRELVRFLANRAFSLCLRLDDEARKPEDRIFIDDILDDAHRRFNLGCRYRREEGGR